MQEKEEIIKTQIRCGKRPHILFNFIRSSCRAVPPGKLARVEQEGAKGRHRSLSLPASQLGSKAAATVPPLPPGSQPQPPTFSIGTGRNLGWIRIKSVNKGFEISRFITVLRNTVAFWLSRAGTKKKNFFPGP